MTPPAQIAEKHLLHLVLLEGLPVYQQLQLEEALLRADTRNWCLINTRSPPGIVMGISGKPELLIDEAMMARHPIPLIRRFSGGGTVFVDQDTLFVTWICNQSQTNIPCCPEKIHRWAAAQYSMMPLKLLENDYVIGERKCGGNAQYLCKQRWLHHTSFLWDYDPLNMRYLKMPPKTPVYRQMRSHDDFLCRLKEHFSSRSQFQQTLLQQLQQQFHIVESSFIEVLAPDTTASQKSYLSLLL